VLVTGNERDLFSPALLEPLLTALGPRATAYETAHSSYKDGVQQEAWLAARYGFSTPLLPPHWR
jgi:hypothetical protein